MGHFADFFIEGTQLVGTKSPGDQGKLFGLFDQGIQDAWMAMALIEGGVRCQHIQIFIAVHVPDPDALAPGQNYIQGLVVVSPKLVLKVNKTLCAQQSSSRVHRNFLTNSDIIPPLI